MNTMIFSKSGASAGIGFAVPARTIARVVPQIIATGHVAQRGFGITIDPLGRLESRFGIHGVVVLEVPDGSAGARAGLRGITQTPKGLMLGDVIVGIDGAEVNDFDDLFTAVDAHKAGDTVTLKVRRDDSTIDVKVDVVER
jgi:S1-C subfamily serine protease